MNVLKTTMTVLLGVLFLFPGQALAVDFSIERSEIEAEVQESGDVFVTENHTYEFDGEFNGITRSLIPPSDGQTITDVQAFEGTEALNVEEENNLYRIYRGGDDETITVTVTYVIEDGVTIYEDMGEFYWPFFSAENESDYENMVITLTPPAPTDDVLALGYDEAEGTAETDATGVVTFDLGHVSEGENGDVRAAWDASVFAAEGSGEIRPELMAAIDTQEKEAAAFAETQTWIRNIGLVILVLAATLLAVLCVRAWVRARRVKREAGEKLSPNGPPREILSLMGTISFNYYHMMTGQAINAALLDLVRKGHVIQETEREFRIVNRNGMLDHERILTEWLFDTIGDGETFTIEQVEAFAKKESNQKIYQDYEAKWHAAIKKEVEAAGFSKKVSTQRKLVLAAVALLVPFLVLFPLFDLLPALFFTVLLVGGLVTFVLAYHPRTLEGVMINREWQRVKKNPDTDHWTEDDQMRVYLYGVGTNDEKISGPIEKKFAGLTPSMDHGGIDIATLLLLSVAISPGFESANAQASATAAASSASTGSAGGVGGGGGGSGAF
ncbi:hypothetical protein JMA_04940 [Jeotgalibacillus malaysiensis]|uniref:DUF2207 domain-containing protein n=1 Tax=Jeotgalibacillus malaysiensis TaxID=1508404 RepID=A0A0B5AIF7_9BACL|nr:DUF2207 domain-containing protein [Jeotgalibacillus malaysiensis]AJD89811.1 hypothetical protein JMA_04940 [Jeotgalibacillus malaysiensis]